MRFSRESSPKRFTAFSPLAARPGCADGHSPGRRGTAF